MTHSNASRKWRWIGAAGIAGSAFVAALFLLSLIVDPTWRFANGWVLEFIAGGFKVAWSQPIEKSMREGWRRALPVYEPWDSYGGPPQVWWFYFDPARRKHFIAPLWILFTGCVMIAVYAKRRTRPFEHGLCPHCGYDIVGIATGACPECGKGTGITKGGVDAPTG